MNNIIILTIACDTNDRKKCSTDKLVKIHLWIDIQCAKYWSIDIWSISMHPIYGKTITLANTLKSKRFSWWNAWCVETINWPNFVNTLDVISISFADHGNAPLRMKDDEAPSVKCQLVYYTFIPIGYLYLCMCVCVA